MLARYKLCYGPVFVRPSVWLGAEGPRDAKSCRETRVATSSLTRPIATGAQQWRGRSIHAAYCYRRAAVTWSVHPCGLLLQTRSCGAFGPSTRSVAIGSMVEQPGGQRTGFALLFRLSVCLSVRPSVTSRCSTKTAKHRITQTTPRDSQGL